MAAERQLQPIFYYDLGSPACYLVAEQIASVLPVVAEWEPVLERSLGAPQDGAPQSDRAEIERRAIELGLQPLRWPARWPPNSEEALLAATYAKRVGRAVAFSLAAFRQAFAAGRDIGERDTVLLAGAASEMHPTALLKAIALRSVSDALQAAAARAHAAGVGSVPAIQLGDRVFAGERGLQASARALEEHG